MRREPRKQGNKVHITLIRTIVDSVIYYRAFCPWENWAIPAVFAASPTFNNSTDAIEAARQRALPMPDGMDDLEDYVIFPGVVFTG
jgi:hypothetical protein